MKTIQLILKDKIKNCHNTNTIFNTKNYIEYADAIQAMAEWANYRIMKEGLCNHNYIKDVSALGSIEFCLKCGQDKNVNDQIII
jgi:hypothetical protein